MVEHPLPELGIADRPDTAAIDTIDRQADRPLVPVGQHVAHVEGDRTGRERQVIPATAGAAHGQAEMPVAVDRDVAIGQHADLVAHVGASGRATGAVDGGRAVGRFEAELHRAMALSDPAVDHIAGSPVECGIAIDVIGIVARCRHAFDGVAEPGVRRVVGRPGDGGTRQAGSVLAYDQRTGPQANGPLHLRFRIGGIRQLPAGQLCGQGLLKRLDPRFAAQFQHSALCGELLGSGQRRRLHGRCGRRGREGRSCHHKGRQKAQEPDSGAKSHVSSSRRASLSTVCGSGPCASGPLPLRVKRA